MTDAGWCRENAIAVRTFYNWVSRCRKTAAGQIPAPNYGHCEAPRSKQGVVLIDIVSGYLPEQHIAPQMHQTNLDNPHTIEVSMDDVIIHISNDADPALPTRKRFVKSFCSLGEVGGAGAEPPHNLPIAAEVVQTVLPLE